MVGPLTCRVKKVQNPSRNNGHRLQRCALPRPRYGAAPVTTRLPKFPFCAARLDRRLGPVLRPRALSRVKVAPGAQALAVASTGLTRQGTAGSGPPPLGSASFRYFVGFSADEGRCQGALGGLSDPPQNVIAAVRTLRHLLVRKIRFDVVPRDDVVGGLVVLDSLLFLCPRDLAQIVDTGVGC